MPAKHRGIATNRGRRARVTPPTVFCAGAVGVHPDLPIVCSVPLIRQSGLCEPKSSSRVVATAVSSSPAGEEMRCRQTLPRRVDSPAGMQPPRRYPTRRGTGDG